METYGQRIERLENEVADLRQASILQSRLLDDYRVLNQMLRERVSALESNFRHAGRILAEQVGKRDVDVDVPKGHGNYAAMKNP
jgi:hypothetical protein